MKTWTEYCNKLYNYHIAPNESMINLKTNENTKDYLPILESEVENAFKTLKYDNSPGNDNIPNELLKHGGESITKKIHYNDMSNHMENNKMAKSID